MGFFGTLRGQKASPVRQIESLNTRLEKARVIVAEGRIFPVLNKDGHYVEARDTLGEARTGQVIDVVARLEELADIRELTRLLGEGP